MWCCGGSGRDPRCGYLEVKAVVAVIYAIFNPGDFCDNSKDVRDCLIARSVDSTTHEYTEHTSADVSLMVSIVTDTPVCGVRGV
jgi:hypothetical protein